MFLNFEILLIKRFLFSKKTDGYVSVFSWFSIFGIMIGVSAIIIVMSVMNGFREELTKRLIGINGHLNIYSQNGNISQDEYILINKHINEDIYAIPIVETQALLINDYSSQGIFLKGYDIKDISSDHFLSNSIVEGKIFSNSLNQIVIGYALANRLGIDIGDYVRIAIPKTDATIFGNIPRFKTLEISGIFNVGMYEFDSNFVFSNAFIARKLLIMDEDAYNKIEVISDFPENIEITQKFIDFHLKSINKLFYSLSWKENNASLINALKVEKNVMFLILTLIILVAAMNIISGLIIFVKEKSKDIGILKTIGISNYNLIKIFLSIGLLIGIIGTFFGVIIGVVFSLNISTIQNFLEKITKTNLFSHEIYYLSSLPSKVELSEIIYVIIISLLICLIATIFPAYRSSIIDPVKTLKND